ncbi:hypothetical protein DL768_003466 [Monosporascus sp. mg162]|nr:hypothetical protein DL768_003466 [Monosporascus sp. mg162]
MRVFALPTALVAAASTVLASEASLPTFAITEPAEDCRVVVDKPFHIKWTTRSNGSDKVTVSLAGGKTPQTLLPCGVISSDINDVGHMQWDVKGHKPLDGSAWECPEAWNDLANNIFGIKIVTEADNAEHWSAHFNITQS